MKLTLSSGEAIVDVRFKDEVKKVGSQPLFFPSVPKLDDKKQPVFDEDGFVVMEPAYQIFHLSTVKPFDVPVEKVIEKNTHLNVKLANGKEISVKVTCHPTDQFSRAHGRYAAVRALFEKDTNDATDIAVKNATDIAAKNRTQVCNSTLKKAAKKLYLLSREDREIIFKAVCPFFFQPSAEIVTKQEKELYAALKVKYEPDLNVAAK